MNESKTIRTWLLELPKEISDRAISNAMKHNKATDTRTRRIFIDTVTKMSLKAAINGSFLFNETPEGGKFWKDVTKGIYPKIKEELKQEEAKQEEVKKVDENQEKLYYRVVADPPNLGVRPPEIIAAEIKAESEPITPEEQYKLDRQQQS